MNRTLILECEACETRYAVERVASRSLQVSIIQFAVCPCGTPNNPTFRKKWESVKRCANCGLPLKWMDYTRPIRGKCGRCHKNELYRRKVGEQSPVSYNETNDILQGRVTQETHETQTTDVS